MIALVVAGCIVLLMIVAGSLVAWRALSSPEGQKMVKIVGETTKMAQEAANAPGTRELRSLGCAQAVVIDSERMKDLMRDVVDASGGDDSFGAPRLLIQCQVGVFGTPPSCESVMSTYLRAVPSPAGDSLVSVQKQGSSSPECTMHYDSQGNPILDTSRRR